MRNVGIIGCGNIARVHAAILQKQHADARLIFCDRTLTKAESFSKRFGGHAAYESVDALLANQKLDAVHVLTQPDSHAALASQTIGAGIHTYIEKPVTGRVAEYRELARLAATTGAVLCPGYSMLGMPVVKRAKEIIEAGRFGRLVTVHSDFNWTGEAGGIPYKSADHWAYTLEGGILQNLVDHPTSLLVDAIDPPEHSSVLLARRSELPNKVADLLHVAVQNDHQIGSYTTSFGHGNTNAHVTYFLEQATVSVDLRRELLTLSMDRSLQGTLQKAGSGLRLSWQIGTGTVTGIARRIIRSTPRESGIAGLIRNFYRTIDGHESLLVREETAVGVISLLERVWDESTGRRGQVGNREGE
jgi:predicted dehydrogenase